MVANDESTWSEPTERGRQGAAASAAPANHVATSITAQVLRVRGLQMACGGAMAGGGQLQFLVLALDNNYKCGVMAERA
jgi:hypothetical protein